MLNYKPVNTQEELDSVLAQGFTAIISSGKFEIKGEGCAIVIGTADVTARENAHVAAYSKAMIAA